MKSQAIGNFAFTSLSQNIASVCLLDYEIDDEIWRQRGILFREVNRDVYKLKIVLVERYFFLREMLSTDVNQLLIEYR